MGLGPWNPTQLLLCPNTWCSVALGLTLRGRDQFRDLGPGLSFCKLAGRREEDGGWEA